MIRIFILFISFITNSFCVSNESNLEFVSSNPKIEDLKIVKSYPFEEGQNISKISPKPSKKPIFYTQNELKYMEELRQISMEEFDEADEKKNKQTQEVEVEQKEIEQKKHDYKIPDKIIEKAQNIEKEEKKVYKNIEKPQIKEQKNINPFYDISEYEEMIIEVDSSTNIMTIKAKIEDQINVKKTFKVSTGKIGIQRPLGDGKITKVSLNPIWYPTGDTIKTFKKKGIFLPSVVLPNDKYNYMGAAKINLTHEVNGKNTFRIHGTLNEKTIGTNESSGCIRMKNNEVTQLATLINDFAKLKSINEIKVILK